MTVFFAGVTVFFAGVTVFFAGAAFLKTALICNFVANAIFIIVLC